MRQVVFPWLVAGISAGWIVACSLAVQSELDGKPESAGGAPTADASMMDADAAGGHDLDAPADMAQDMSSEPVGEAGADVADADGPGEDTAACGPCDAGSQCCNGECVDVASDERHCGSCGHACSAGRECSAGSCSGGWVSMRDAPQDSGRAGACAVWTGDRVFIWGGVKVHDNNTARDDGLLYDPKLDQWSVVDAGSSTPAPRVEPVCLWTGSRVLVWGGVKPAGQGVLNDGALYDPAADQWEALPDGGLEGRARPLALWTGSSAIIWGGTNPVDNKGMKSGATWTQSNGWHVVSTTSAPTRNKELAGVWTGESLLVFGGRDDGGGQVVNTLLRYEPPPTDAWAWVQPTGTPPASRSSACVAFAESRMVIWGGFDKSFVPLAHGARVTLTVPPAWEPLTDSGAPTARACVPYESGWVAVDAARVYLLGGLNDNKDAFQDGGIYDIATDKWSAIESWGSGGSHKYGVGVWTGEEFVVWGGYDGSTPLLGGSRWKP